MGRQPYPESDPLRVAEEVQVNPVSVSIHKNDPRVLTAVIDRTMSLPEIMKALRQALRSLVPYRHVDPRIFQAVQLVNTGEVKSYREASVRVFGTPAKADLIRYWHNKWGRK